MALTIMLAVWLAHSRGLFRCADDFLGDLIHARHATSYAPNNVLLVYTDRQLLKSNDDRLVELIKAIEPYQPSQIGIAARLSSEQQARLVAADVANKLVVGTSLAELSEPSGQNAAKHRIPRGFLDLQLRGQPVYRWHRARVINAQQVAESLEARLARGQLGTEARIPLGEFGIRFQGGAAGLPHVNDQSFIDGTVISELVQDRIVLIGPDEEDGLGIVTPTTYGSDRMTRLELHGNILETILRNTPIRRANQFHILITLLVITITSSLVFRQVPTSWIIRAGIASLAVGTILFWTTLAGFSIQLSLMAIWLTSLLNFVGVLKSRFQILTHFFDQWRLLRRTNIKSTWNASYEEIWSSVATSTLQIFHPNRLVLMELETGSTHLQVREIRGCDVEAITEKRRDVSRVPFRNAVELRNPVSIDDRPFLVQDEDGSQFMVPLIDGANVQGMMVLEMDRSAIMERDFEDRLSEFADKMAAFLAGTRERELERILSNMTVRRFRLLPESIAARALFQDETDHRRYEDLLARALDCSEVAVAIYDVFGNLLKSNKRMIDHLQERNIPVVETNCADILAAFTGRSVRSCRELVRQCLIGNRAEEILLAPEHADEAASVLYVKPLRSSDGSADDGVENRCISIQYVDGGIFHDMRTWQTQFALSQSAVLQDQISRLQQAASRIDSDETDPALQQYTSLANEVLDAVEQCQSAINFGLSEEPEDYFANDSTLILQAALDTCKEECESRGITIKQTSQVADTEAFSNPILLRRVFAFAIECLLNDASRQTEIVIKTTRTNDRLCYRFDVVARTATASGGEQTPTPAWKLSETTERGKAAMVLIQKHSDRLIEISRCLRQWGATLKYECAGNYQPSIEIDLACSESDRHSDAIVDELTMSASFSHATENANA